MARRKTKPDLNWKVLVLILAIPVLGIYYFVEKFGWIWAVTGIVLIILLIVVFKLIKASRRRSILMAKYKNESLVDDIVQSNFWQGQTADQLMDALGKPDDIDEKVLKTKIKSVWKYNHLGGNRYGLRINLDDGVVSGWDLKE